MRYDRPAINKLCITYIGSRHKLETDGCHAGSEANNCLALSLVVCIMYMTRAINKRFFNLS